MKNLSDSHARGRFVQDQTLAIISCIQRLENRQQPPIQYQMKSCCINHQIEINIVIEKYQILKEILFISNNKLKTVKFLYYVNRNKKCHCGKCNGGISNRYNFVFILRLVISILRQLKSSVVQRSRPVQFSFLVHLQIVQKCLE